MLAGVCGGSNATIDCAGQCFGSAAIDDCGVCSGGRTGKVANSNKDCAGLCFGNNTCVLGRKFASPFTVRTVVLNTPHSMPVTHFVFAFVQRLWEITLLSKRPRMSSWGRFRYAYRPAALANLCKR
jgi:hypothetical protein